MEFYLSLELLVLEVRCAALRGTANPTKRLLTKVDLRVPFRNRPQFASELPLP